MSDRASLPHFHLLLWHPAPLHATLLWAKDASGIFFFGLTAGLSTGLSPPPSPITLHECYNLTVWDLSCLTWSLFLPVTLTVSLFSLPFSFLSFFFFFQLPDGKHWLVVQLWYRRPGWVFVCGLQRTPHPRIWSGNRAEPQNKGELKTTSSYTDTFPHGCVFKG